eukprot:scaffold544_cov320-Pavlova_lutheri.AAC.8
MQAAPGSTPRVSPMKRETTCLGKGNGAPDRKGGEVDRRGRGCARGTPSPPPCPGGGAPRRSMFHLRTMGSGRDRCFGNPSGDACRGKGGSTWDRWDRGQAPRRVLANVRHKRRGAIPVLRSCPGRTRSSVPHRTKRGPIEGMGRTYRSLPFGCSETRCAEDRVPNQAPIGRHHPHGDGRAMWTQKVGYLEERRTPQDENGQGHARTSGVERSPSRKHHSKRNERIAKETTDACSRG